MCPGDSGGPALLDFGDGEEIAGVHSTGDVGPEGCGTDATSVTLFHRLEWIDAFVAAAAPSCRADDRCAADCGPLLDPDCPVDAPDAGPGELDAGPDASPPADAGLDAATDAGPESAPASGGCGCSAGGRRRAPLSTWLLLIAAGLCTGAYRRARIGSVGRRRSRR